MKIGLQYLSSDTLGTAQLENSTEALLSAISKDDILLEASTEGMLLQDTLRWHVEGFVMSFFLASLNRIEMKLNKIVARCGYDAKYRETVINHDSQYLPDYDITKNVLDTLDELYAFILDVSKGLHQPSGKKVTEILAKAGIVGDHVDISKTNWKLIKGSAMADIVGAIIGIGIGGVMGKQAGHGVIGMFLGKEVVGGAIDTTLTIKSKKADKEQSKTIKDRGWTDSGKVVDACRQTLIAIDNFYKIQDLLKSININIPKDASIEYRHAVRILYKTMKGSVKAYIKAIKTIGRGLAALPVISIYDI